MNTPSEAKHPPVYVVAGYKPWNHKVYEQIICQYPGRWHYIQNTSELTHQALDQLQPRYIFFLHWSWIVPKDIYENYECVCFHMTDVPYGRGGSPLQNLILRGREQTVLTALRMTEELEKSHVDFV